MRSPEKKIKKKSDRCSSNLIRLLGKKENSFGNNILLVFFSLHKLLKKKSSGAAGTETKHRRSLPIMDLCRTVKFCFERNIPHFFGQKKISKKKQKKILCILAQCLRFGKLRRWNFIFFSSCDKKSWRGLMLDPSLRSRKIGMRKKNWSSWSC